MASIQYKLPITAASEAIHRFNNDWSTIFADYLTHAHFSKFTRPFVADEIATGAILIDSIWSTNISKSGKDIYRICDSLREACSIIDQEFLKLDKNDLRDNPEKIMKAAKKLFKITLDAKGVKKSHYSFSTKLFHWFTNVHFPMMDSKARIAIIEFQKKSKVPEERIFKPQSKPEPLDDYRDWIFFYSDLLSNISEREAEYLMQADAETKHSGLVFKNELLRVLDKAFWMWGKEEQ